MSQQRPDEHWAAVLAAAVKNIQEHMAKARAAEAARKAKLTPAQLETERRAEQQRRVDQERAKIMRPLAKMGARLTKRETWTTDEFSWILVGVNPADVDEWAILDQPSSKTKKLRDEIKTILESCIGAGLAPVNANESPDKHRFAIDSLLSVAKRKQLGQFEILGQLLGLGENSIPPPAPRAQAAQPPAAPRKPGKSLKRWHAQIEPLMTELQRAAAELKDTFDREALPGSWKIYDRLIAAMCERANIPDAPPSPEAVRKKATELGYSLGGTGARASASDATLRRWAKTAGIATD
jgi:hypothetical protein